MSENYNKYLTELTLSEIEIFESVAGDLLKERGYTGSSDQNRSHEIIQSDINRYQMQNKKLKNHAIVKASHHDIELKCHQKELLKMLKKKLLIDPDVSNRRVG